MTPWYYVHSPTLGYLTGHDANGQPIWIYPLFSGAPLWITNDYYVALRAARGRRQYVYRVSDWLLERITPYRQTG